MIVNTRTTKKFGLSSLALGLAAAALLSGCNNKGGGATAVGTGSTTDNIATVNGEPISRGQVLTLAELTAGPQVLSQLVQLTLIEQAMKKAGVTVPAEEIDKAYKKAQETQGESFTRLTSTEGGKELVRRQLAAQLGVERLVTKDIKADEAAVKTWFDKHKADYGTPATVTVGVLFASTKTRADLMAQQLKSKAKTFPQLVAEQQKADDPMAKQSKEAMPPIPVSQLKTGMGPLASVIEKLQPGQTSAVTAMPGGKMFLILHLKERTAAVAPDFTKMKAEIENDYKLEQLARQETKGGFDAAIKQVQAQMAQQSMMQPGSPPPTYRSALAVMAEKAKGDLLQKMRAEAKVDVTDKMYDEVAKQFAPAAAPAAAGSATNAAPASGAPAPGAPAPATP